MATAGRNTPQRTDHKLAYASTDLLTVTYDYSSTHALHDADASRMTNVKIGTTTIASYFYNGSGHVVAIDHPEPDIFSRRYGSTSGVYPDLDRFNRITSDTLVYGPLHRSCLL